MRKIIQIQVMPETQNECSAVFEGSQHHKNLEHQKKIIEFAMGAVDLNSMYGNAEARKIALERFKHNIEEALEHHG